MTQTKPTPQTTASSTGKWQPYPAYKDSSVEWLGEIPEHWEVWKIAHAFKQIGSGTTPLTSNEEYYDGDISWVNTSELRDGLVIDTSKKLTKKALLDLPTLRLYPVGTLLVALYGATIGKVGILAIPATTNQACCALSDSKELSVKFTFYWLLAFRRKLILLASGGGQPNISQDIIRSLRIPAPLFPEQQAIAAFLDRETTRINTLIAKKERLIELLQEKRAALISQAVTKGLDPRVPMRDAGIEWLGEIPAHWEVKRLKFVARFLGGGTPSKDNLDFWSGDIPWVSPKDMKAETISEAEDHITPYAVAHSATRLIQPGAVLIVVRSGILRHTIPVAINACTIALNQDMKALVTKPYLMAEYLAAFIRGNQQALLVEWRKEGATVESIEYELLANTPCLIPPLKEQQAIVVYLDRETARIDALVSRIREAIEKLREYSAALISAAVTGKIDVREKV